MRSDDLRLILSPALTSTRVRHRLTQIFNSLPYHFSLARDALSNAARQSSRNSAKMKSGVLEPFSADALLIDVSISFRKSLILPSECAIYVGEARRIVQATPTRLE